MTVSQYERLLERHGEAVRPTEVRPLARVRAKRKIGNVPAGSVGIADVGIEGVNQGIDWQGYGNVIYLRRLGSKDIEVIG